MWNGGMVGWWDEVVACNLLQLAASRLAWMKSQSKTSVSPDDGEQVEAIGAYRIPKDYNPPSPSNS